MPSVTVIKRIAGNGPFEYTWTSDEACVSFSNPSGITTEYVETEVIYTNSVCLAAATITLNVTDANGCTDSEEVVVTDLCDSFGVSDIAYIPPFKFVLNAGNANCSSTDITWTFNDRAFVQESITETAFTSTLQLSPRFERTSPSSFNIYATAVDCNGCSVSKTYSLTLCIPTPLDYQVDLTKGDTLYESPSVSLADPTGCLGYTYDWSTLQMELPSGWTFTRENNSVKISTSAVPGVYSGKYSVATDKKIRANKGTFTFIVHAQEEGKTIAIADKRFDLDCTKIPGDIVDFEIESLVTVTVGTTVDWSTWQLVEPPTPKSPSIVLSTNSLGKRIIRYTLPNPIVADAFGWTVADTNGNFAKATVSTLVDCQNTPTANNDTAEVACGGSVNIRILDNDLGNGSPLLNTSVVIESSPTYGTLVIVGDGTVTYTAQSNYNGSDQFTYSVENAFGKRSTAATVTITVSCAGSNVDVTLCD